MERLRLSATFLKFFKLVVMSMKGKEIKAKIPGVLVNIPPPRLKPKRTAVLTLGF
ncbi:MAG: hypothetical protein CH104c_0378 [Candidatus Woesebacteria bacterium]|nr:MAG: hypothetical protein CH104c_0378 [Candidatus Woesebacteria bacterium]